MNNCSLYNIYVWNLLGNSNGTQFLCQCITCLGTLPVQSSDVNYEVYVTCYFKKKKNDGAILELRVSGVLQDLIAERHEKVCFAINIIEDRIKYWWV